MKNTQELAQKIIKEMFNKLRLNFLGPNYIDKSAPYILDNFDPSTTLGSLYTHALSQNAIHPDAIDAETLDTLNATALGLVDKLQENILHEVDTTFNLHMNEVNVKSKIAGKTPEEILSSDSGKEIKDKVAAQLKFIFNKMNNGIDRIVVNESHNAQTFGAMDGIIHMSQSVGISDPVIAKRGIIDENMCKYCRQLWHTEANINIPKVYKMSELQGGYMDRKDPQATINMTHPHCFTSGATPVLTEKGWKALKSIKINDLVLTHTGKFKKVVNTINEPYAYKKAYKITYQYQGKTYSIGVSPDHKMLTNCGWVEAQHLKKSHKLVGLNYPCHNCGKQTELVKSSKGFKLRTTCSSECLAELSKENAIKQHSEMSDVQKSIRAANCSHGTKKAYLEGRAFSHFQDKNYWTNERRAQCSANITARMDDIMKASASTRISKQQKYAFGWIKNYFHSENIHMEYKVDKYYLDIALVDHKIAVEIDGKYHSGDRIIKDQQRDENLKLLGWTTIRFGVNSNENFNRDNVINSISRLLNNHNGKYEFDYEVEILDIKQTQTGKSGRLYCITVDEDESFIAKGVVSHNCRHVITSVMPGFGFDDSGKLIYKGRDENGELWDEYKHQRG